VRVAWVVDRVPSAATERLGLEGQRRGGWQDALLASLATTPQMELLVVFAGPVAGAVIATEGVLYVCVGPGEPVGRAARVAGRWRNDGPEPRVLEETSRVLSEWQPDLVHVHGTESSLGVVAEHLSAPVLISLQGVLSVYETLSHDDRSRRHPGGGGLAALVRGTSPWHQSRIAGQRVVAERQMLSRCVYVAGRTAFDQRAAAVLAPLAKYYRVGEILREPFYRSPSHVVATRSGGAAVACLAGWEFYRKGVDTAIEAAAMLRQLGTALTLRVVGAHPESVAGRLTMAYARSRGVDDMVVLCGDLTAEGIACELRGSDIFLLPSRVDNSPNSLSEAMMLGVPCVASTAGGIPSLATDGEDALLVPPGDAYSLAGAMRAVLLDCELARRLSAAAQARARARHDPETVRAELLAAYAQIVAEGDSHSGRAGQLGTADSNSEPPSV
jgi:glycosyltransferase involved in cell wall biosynthesis